MSATKILMLGATGVGKSTLSNFIAGDKIFQESCKDSSCTKEVSIRAAKEGTKYENVIIIDTPGILDSDGQDQENMEKITKKLKEIKGDGIKAILLLVNANDTRINDADKKSLCIYCKMFPIIDFFEHVALVFTKTYESFSEKKFKKIVEEKVGDFRVSLEKILSKIVTDINKSENTHIRTPDGLQCFFTDCGEDGEDYDYKRTAPEVDRLVNWCNSQDIMCLDGIDSKVDVDCVRLEEAGEFELKSNEEIINNNKKKLIRRFIKRYKKIDFHGKETIVNGDEPVREEIYFLKRVKESEDEERIPDEKDKTKFLKIKTPIYRWDLYDKYDNFLKEGPKQKGEKNINECILVDKKIDIEYYTEEKVLKEDTYKILDHLPTEKDYLTIANNKAYIVTSGRKSYKYSAGEIAIIALNCLHPVVAIIFAIGGIISLFRRKKRWKIPYRVYFDEKKMKFKTINDLGIIKEHDPERVGEVYNEITEFYMNPYQVD